MNIPIKNTRGQEVGFIKDLTYHSQRDWEKGQIFHNPKYTSAIALDTDIIKQLIRHHVADIKILVVNFEQHPFFITSTLNNFLIESKKINFDRRKEGVNYTGYGEQRYMEMNKWIREYPCQKKLA